MSADEHDGGLRARVDGAIGNLDAAIAELGEHLERADGAGLERLHECLARLKTELDYVVARVTELERRLDEASS
jgi:hypothetical protein